MCRAVLIVCFLCLGISLVVCQDIDFGEYGDPEPSNGEMRLSEKLKIINSIILKYDRELDKMVPFNEIREAIEGLDIMARNYTGACVKDINKASHLGYQATDNYFRGTDKIIQWCASASRVFNFILKNHNTLPEGKIQRAIKRSLSKGVTALKDSIRMLGTVVRQLSEMERTLRPVPDNLSKELKELQLEHEHAVKALRRKGTIINTALTALGMLVGFILSFYLGPVGGGIIGVTIKMALSQIPNNVIERRIVPTMEEKIKITEAYYLALIKTVEHAGANVTNVRNELDKRLQFVEMNLQSGATEVNPAEGLQRSDKTEAGRIIEELREFITTINEMKSRHLPPETRYRRRRNISNLKSPLHPQGMDKMISRDDEIQYEIQFPYKYLTLPNDLYLYYTLNSPFITHWKF